MWMNVSQNMSGHPKCSLKWQHSIWILERHFVWIGCTSEALKSLSNSTQCMFTFYSFDGLKKIKFDFRSELQLKRMAKKKLMKDLTSGLEPSEGFHECYSKWTTKAVATTYSTLARLTPHPSTPPFTYLLHVCTLPSDKWIWMNVVLDQGECKSNLLKFAE